MYKYELRRTFNMAVSHSVPNAGKCANLHGHNIDVTVTIKGNELDDTGFLVNFATVKDLIHGRYDHTHLNDHIEFKKHPPTSENIAREIMIQLNHHFKVYKYTCKCTKVELSETGSSYVAVNYIE